MAARLTIWRSLLVAVLLAACTAGTTATYPPLGVTAPPAGPGVAGTVQQVIAAAGGRGVAVRPADRPYRPPEGPLLAAAPRTVLQAQVQGDPGHGQVVVYELPDASAASSAARDQAAYIASGPGRVQFVPDTRYVIRVVGATVVFFHWSPDTSPDPAMGSLAEALETLGTGVAVPS